MKSQSRLKSIVATAILIAAMLAPSASTLAAEIFIPFDRHIIGDLYGNGAHSVYAVDLDQDGDVDVLGAGGYSTYNGEVAWWENDGAQTFTKHSIIDDAFDNATSVYATDIDGDEDIDVLAASAGSSDIAWWENDGNESFTQHLVDGSFYGAYSVYAADIDDDGDVDILGAASTGDDISWWESDGTPADGGWIEHLIDGSFDGACSVYAADVDGDGNMDILGAASYADDIAWWESDGTPADEGWTKHLVDASFDGARAVYAEDVDGDGNVDVLGAASYADEIVLWKNDGSPEDDTWLEHPVDLDFNEAWSVHIQDMNGDGELDIVGAGDDSVAWWENDGEENFARRNIGDNCYGAESVYAIDVDGDADTDALCAADNSYVLMWYEQQPPQGMTFLPFVSNIPPPPSQAPVLNPINNPDKLRTFTVSWSSVSGATGYVLEEDTNSSFDSPRIAYTGSSTSRTVTVAANGTYYYRVKATNVSGSGPWSNCVSTVADQDAVIPRPGYWSGGSVSFRVSSDSTEVEYFDLDVYVSGCGTYTLRWTDLPITNGEFSKGEFDTPTSADGSCSYIFQACNGWVIGTTGWSATWRYY